LLFSLSQTYSKEICSMVGKIKLTSAGIVRTDIKGNAVRQHFCRVTREWKPVGSTSAPKPAATKTSAPKAAKPTAPAKPKNPVLESFVTYFGAARGAVLYCDHGGHRATMADCQRAIREDLQAKAAAKAEADRVQALVNSDNPALSFGAAQAVKLQAAAKVTTAAQASSAPVRLQHPYRKVEASDKREAGRSAGADFSAAIAKRIAK
jgi:hypothetical protein